MHRRIKMIRLPHDNRIWYPTLKENYSGKSFYEASWQAASRARPSYEL